MAEFILISYSGGKMNIANRRIVLIYGEPQAGKSTLADELKIKHRFHVISLDEEYPKFVKIQYPNIYLPLLNRVIAQHYMLLSPIFLI